MYLKNTTGQILYFLLLAASDGTAITSGTVTGYRTIDGGTQAATTGTISHKGNGQWQINLSQADTNGDNIGYLFTHADSLPVAANVVTVEKRVSDLNDFDPAVDTVDVGAVGGTAVTGPDDLKADVSGLNDISAADVWDAATRTLTAGTNIVLAKGTGVTGFNDLDAAGVRTAVGLASADLDTQLSGLDGDIAALNDLDAAGVRSAVGLASANLDTQLGDIYTDTQRVDGLIEDSTGDRFTAKALEEAGGGGASAADVWDLNNGIETGLTPRGAIRLIAAAAAGKASGLNTTTAVYRNAVQDSKARLTATVDEHGNRTAITADTT
jgi:hypothetical protein